MTRAIRFKDTIESLRPVDFRRLDDSVLFSEQTAILWRNCEMCSRLAQEIADPHGSSEMAHLAASVVGAAAECKLALTGLLEHANGRRSRVRYTQRVVRNYQKLKEAMERLGPMTGRDWGVIIPSLL